MLYPDIFYDIIQKSLKKLAQDECYPEEIYSQSSNFRMNCSVANLPAYNLITPVINSFNGDVEKFYTSFYKVFVKVCINICMLKILLEGLMSTAQLF